MSIGKGISTSNGFDLLSRKPLDTRDQADTLEELYNLPLYARWIGMECYVTGENKKYKLIGGTENNNWKEYDYYNDIEVDTSSGDTVLNFVSDGAIKKTITVGASGGTGGGNTWYLGTTSPSGIPNVIAGDLYLNTITSEYYRYENNIWTLKGNLKGQKGDKGDKGDRGLQGISGGSLYTWIMYADDESGANITTIPTGKAYMGTASNKETQVPSTDPNQYRWIKVKGENGATGNSKYTWIKYADTITGNNMSDSPLNKDYIGIAYNKTSETPSNIPRDYQWSLYRGDTGPEGPIGPDGKPRYTWIKYADTPTTGMSDNPEGKEYIGLSPNQTSEVESTNYADYKWSRIKGDEGPPGPPGPEGPQGPSGNEFPNNLPDVPILTAEPLFATIALSWTFDNKPYYDYEVYASQTQNFIPSADNQIFKGKASSFLFEASPNQVWYFVARAVNSYGKYTNYSTEVSASTIKISDSSVYFTEAAIMDASIGTLRLDRGWFGQLSGTQLNAKGLRVSTSNGTDTLDIDSFGNVKMNVTEFKIVNKTIEDIVDENLSYTLAISSTNGTIFKNGDISSELIPVLKKGNVDVTNDFPENRFIWTRKSNDSAGDVVWNNKYKLGKKRITITTEDVKVKAVFSCTVLDEFGNYLC